jgi:hypothetical protein
MALFTSNRLHPKSFAEASHPDCGLQRRDRRNSYRIRRKDWNLFNELLGATDIEIHDTVLIAAALCMYSTMSTAST